MSALGQKQTCAVQTGMSALPPRADMCSALVYVRFVPIADIALFDLVLLDELVCSPNKAIGDVETECFGGF
jgi:hypothetical protein